jgi:acyl carrier protein
MTSTSGPAFGQLAQIIEDKLGIPRGSVKPDTRLKDLEIDSLSLLEVVLDVEEEFGSQIATDDLNATGTAEEFHQFVLTALSNQA